MTKKVIGSTTADKSVVQVPASSAVSTEESELIHASKMFFVSFIKCNGTRMKRIQRIFADFFLICDDLFYPFYPRSISSFVSRMRPSSICR